MITQTWICIDQLRHAIERETPNAAIEDACSATLETIVTAIICSDRSRLAEGHRRIQDVAGQLASDADPPFPVHRRVQLARISLLLEMVAVALDQLPSTPPGVGAAACG